MKSVLEGHENPTTVLIAREINAISDLDIIIWANCHRASESYADDADFLDLTRSNPRNESNLGRARQHLGELVRRRFPAFSLTSKEGEEIARSIFLRRIEGYLEDASKPFQTCLMLAPIESLYDYPEWLGDFDNGCDWIDQHTRREDAQHLHDVIAVLLAANRVRPSLETS
ncbi:MAG TPA: hypothetical protein VGV39_27570 [Mesorhizobium sp.]|jgi:hypothetical protein|uniref:hypothetical protein n=1 Tax=Mesorhizobium sp. TaxID=1871066 RepID=UPI002DDD197D|nr:hypothetical protein [Mesorhizobium sp.]HEV2506862.1 hypothetical protein [Mesorhizobium sp.]